LVSDIKMQCLPKVNLSMVGYSNRSLPAFGDGRYMPRLYNQQKGEGDSSDAGFEGKRSHLALQISGISVKTIRGFSPLPITTLAERIMYATVESLRGSSSTNGENP